ncbi:uncharacterized protein CLUP02_06592 [Colletotrichum lupini]|uniref:Uncharacterized protein n=1 Tax=Colletotrichum lupini TaxID=145971 RepID=A0A9Q8SPJ2_9PEZI|nr:uncharacterized protein CLUP02_06592 [Colletotrichum lupini]UQC81106.1 hypothetical protein CLUP02_06592 [Colletotrichum lupini]
MWSGNDSGQATVLRRRRRRGGRGRRGRNTAMAVENNAMEVDNTAIDIDDTAMDVDVDNATVDVDNITTGVNHINMASTNNPAITDAQRRCILLTIPYEIRYKIYIQVIKGSNVTCDSIVLVRNNRRLRGGPVPAWAATAEHSDFLLACRQIYDEARPIYWARSLVDSGAQRFPTMADLLGPFARQNAEHIQGIVGNLRYSEQPAEFLESFPRAKTVRLSDSFVTHFSYEMFVGVTEDEESVVAHIKNRMEAKGLDKLVADVQFGRGVQFLVAAILIGHPVKGDGTVVKDEKHKHKHCFYNMTTGKLLVVDAEIHRGSLRKFDEDHIDLDNFEQVLEGRYLRGMM